MNHYYKCRKEKDVCSCGRNKDVGRARCKDCQKASNEYAKERKRKARSEGICNDCFSKPPHLSFSKCLECLKNRQSSRYKSNRKLKQDVISAYGGKCACCGETRIEFLTIDHVNGDGAEHRKKCPGNIYRWYRNHGYPTGFQVLCMNCNLSKGLYGYCPHQKEGIEDWAI